MLTICPSLKIGAKNFYICLVFRQLWDLMANIFRRKHDIDKGIGKYKGSPTSSHNFMNLGPRLKIWPEFLPMLSILFRPCPLHTLWEAWTWRLTATLNKTALGLAAAQIWSPKRCYVGNAIASVGLKWKYIVMIATLSSWGLLSHVFSGNIWVTDSCV